MSAPLTDPDDLTGPLDRPLTKEEWDFANRFIRGLRNKLEAETEAATRYAKELADCRAVLDNVKRERDEALKEIEELQDQLPDNPLLPR